MRIERATITAMRLVEHIEVHLHATDTIIQSNQAAVRRTLMDAIAIGLAIYSHPERNGPTNGWTKGHTDEPSFQAQDPSNLQHLTARARRAMKTAIELQTTSQNDASNSRWTRHWDPKNQTTVTDIVRLRDQHKCVIVRTSMQPNNSDSSPGNRLGKHAGTGGHLQQDPRRQTRSSCSTTSTHTRTQRSPEQSANSTRGSRNCK